MLNAKLPRNKYWKANLPNLDPQFEGQAIPLLWGHKHGIVPICINTVTGLWKICEKTKAGRNALVSIDQITADDIVLTSGVDFTPDLVNGEFTLFTSPYLSANTRYWFSVGGTYTINGTDYLYSVCSNGDEGYDGDCYTINGSNVWTIDPAGASLGFKVYGRATIDGEESLMAYFDYVDPRAINLRDAANHTRFGQSFLTGATPFYVTRIQIPLGKNGDPVGTYFANLYSAISSEVPVGLISESRTAEEVTPSGWDINWTLRGTPNRVIVQATGPPLGEGALDQVGYIIEDAYQEVLGGSVADDLVTADFTTLKAAKTQYLGIFLDSEITFNQFIESLEVGQLFKFLPTLSRKYTVKFGLAGDTSVAHFRDEDFLSFKVKRNWKAIFQTIKVKYDEDPEKQDGQWQTKTHESTIADYIYKNTETLTLETKLRLESDAAALAAAYGALLEYPVKTVIFEISCGSGFSLMPMNKVKITRTRGDNAGGAFNGVLFCILEVNKNAVEGTALIVALLDVQTYT